MNYATQRLLAAAEAARGILEAHRQYDDGEPSAETVVAEELESAIHYFNAHGATQAVEA